MRREDGSIDWTATRARFQQEYAEVPAGELGTPAWQDAYAQLWAQEQSRTFLEGMGTTDQRIRALPGLALGAWPPHVRHHGGYVVNPDLALHTPCTRIDLGDGSALVYSKGIIGALSPEEQGTYCVTGMQEEPASDAERTRLALLSRAAHTCSQETHGLAGEDHLDAYYGCLGRMLHGEDA